MLSTAVAAWFASDRLHGDAGEPAVGDCPYSLASWCIHEANDAEDDEILLDVCERQARRRFRHFGGEAGVIGSTSG